MRIGSSRGSGRFCQKRRFRYCEREHRDAEALFGFVKANQAHYSVRVMCRTLQVSPSGFYAWLGRPLSARAREDLGLTTLVHTIHRRSKGAYGAPAIHAELADD